MKHIKKIIFTLTVAILTLVPVMPASAALFDSSVDQACQGVTGGGACNETEANNSVNNIITTVINIFSWIVGIVAVIMIIVGGLKYITSTGDSNSVNGAKNTILYAIIGLVIVASAQIIVKFVLKKV